jgi:integrase
MPRPTSTRCARWAVPGPDPGSPHDGRRRLLRDSLKDYLALRLALGFRLKTAGRLLGQFVSWLEDRGTGTITTADALEWAVLPPGASPAWQSIRLAAVRGFAAYLHGTDPSVQVPPAGLIRRGNDRATPYIYSDDEISAIITAAGALQPEFRAATYQALISLLAASGLRIGEALSLDRSDLDGDQGMLTVRDAKFGKTRLVPLHPSTTGALTRYSELRDEYHPARPARRCSCPRPEPGCCTATSASRSPSSPPRPGWPGGQRPAGPGSTTSAIMRTAGLCALP